MAGYSGTPLPKKLGIRPGLRVRLVRVSPGVRATLKASLRSCRTVPAGAKPVDFLMVFATRRATLVTGIEQAHRTLSPAGMCWGCWPKRTSGVATDLSEGEVRAIGLDHGLVDVKVCAIDPTWSGLKFVRRLADR
ncbi:MAG TPA: DUF3052 domain-containing protein [Thermoplasmata archaeon]|nr:DUF3052 domain-containing protein [Thermoplasmata archaeon]